MDYSPFADRKTKNWSWACYPMVSAWRSYLCLSAEYLRRFQLPGLLTLDAFHSIVSHGPSGISFFVSSTAWNKIGNRWADMEVPSESFHRSSWDSRTCYPRRAFNQKTTDGSWTLETFVLVDNRFVKAIVLHGLE